jgi:hypothetical protein
MQVLDAYALMGDVGGMAEKMQSYFLQEVLSETHCVLKEMLEEVYCMFLLVLLHIEYMTCTCLIF